MTKQISLFYRTIVVPRWTKSINKIMPTCPTTNATFLYVSHPTCTLIKKIRSSAITYFPSIVGKFVVHSITETRLVSLVIWLAHHIITAKPFFPHWSKKDFCGPPSSHNNNWYDQSSFALVGCVWRKYDDNTKKWAFLTQDTYFKMDYTHK